MCLATNRKYVHRCLLKIILFGGNRVRDDLHSRLIHERVYLKRAMCIAECNSMAFQAILLRACFAFQLDKYLLIPHCGLGAVIASGAMALLARYAFLCVKCCRTTIDRRAKCCCMALQAYRVVHRIWTMVLRGILHCSIAKQSRIRPRMGAVFPQVVLVAARICRMASGATFCAYILQWPQNAGRRKPVINDRNDERRYEKQDDAYFYHPNGKSAPQTYKILRDFQRFLRFIFVTEW